MSNFPNWWSNSKGIKIMSHNIPLTGTKKTRTNTCFFHERYQSAKIKLDKDQWEKESILCITSCCNTFHNANSKLISFSKM